MKTILKYLNNSKFSSELRSDDVDETLANDTYTSFIEEMGLSSGNNSVNPLPHLSPKPGIGQIWLCRQEFIDRNGETIKGDIPYYVIIIDNPGKLGDLNFVRVQPLSMFTEFEAEDDRVVEDESITGFKFLIETWNEQPIDVDLLNDYIGFIDLPKQSNDNKVILTQNQREFRRIEIENTAYLRQSVVSYLESKEKTGARKKVVMNLLLAAILIGVGYILWQPFKTGNNKIFETYAVAYPSQFDFGVVGDTSYSRGDECSIEFFTLKECIKADTALSFYKRGEYNKAAKLLSEILKPKEKNTELLFYLAIAQLNSDSIGAAIRNFEFLNQVENYEYRDQVLYYLALAYIKVGDRGKAKRILYRIRESESEYKDKSNEILKKLRWP